jgi:hypothetical protein
MTTEDELKALRSLRDDTARRLGGDAWALARELAEKARAEGRVTVTLPRRVPAPPKAPDEKPTA